MSTKPERTTFLMKTWRRRALEAESRLETIGATIPHTCLISRDDVELDANPIECTSLIGQPLFDGVEWTEQMCCLPCRVRAVLGDE